MTEEMKELLPKDVPHIFISAVAQLHIEALKDELWKMMN
jgi:ribosome-interacting GTPase 1